MLKKFGLSFATFLLCLILLEVVFRAFSLVGSTEREQFLAAHWHWPLVAFDTSDGPLKSEFVAHPYWGVTGNSALAGVNNFGFNDPHHLPYPRRPRETVVALLGGSVASLLHGHLQMATENELKNLLPNTCKPNVKILNLAIATLKQPAQFHIYNYFSEEFDLSVNVDGYNDAFVSSGEGSPSNYPLFYNELFDLNSQKLSALHWSYTLAQIRFKVVKGIRDKKWWASSDAIFLSSKGIFNLLDALINQISYRIRKPIFSLPPKAIDWNIRLWTKYIHAQEAIAQMQNKKSFFILQPSQYANLAKPLSTSERFTVEKDPQRLEMLRTGYKKLSNAVIDLNRRGIDSTDASGLFAGISDERFIDGCCHLNEAGNQELAVAIAKKITPEILKHHSCGQ